MMMIWNNFQVIIIVAGVCFAVRNKSKNGSTAGESTTSNEAESPDIHFPFMQVMDKLNYRVSHGFGIMTQNDYFWAETDNFFNLSIILEEAGAVA